LIAAAGTMDEILDGSQHFENLTGLVLIFSIEQAAVIGDWICEPLF
jgi:hypothetical protein